MVKGGGEERVKGGVGREIVMAVVMVYRYRGYGLSLRLPKKKKEKPN